MKYNTYCPLFPGFYNTVFEYSNEESDIQYYNEEYGTDFNWDDFEWDYKDYENRVAKSFVNRLESELKGIIDIKIDFQELISPKEYNFTNDSINVSIEVELKELIKLVKDRYDDAKVYFKEKYTSCSGFISFHSNNVDEWLNEDYINEKPSHRIGPLLDCLCTIEIDSDSVPYWADDESGYIDFTQKESV